MFSNLKEAIEARRQFSYSKLEEMNQKNERKEEKRKEEEKKKEEKKAYAQVYGKP